MPEDSRLKTTRPCQSGLNRCLCRRTEKPFVVSEGTDNSYHQSITSVRYGKALQKSKTFLVAKLCKFYYYEPVQLGERETTKLVLKYTIITGSKGTLSLDMYENREGKLRQCIQRPQGVVQSNLTDFLNCWPREIQNSEKTFVAIGLLNII